MFFALVNPKKVAEASRNWEQGRRTQEWKRDKFHRVYMHLKHRTSAVYVIGMLLCFDAIPKEC